MFSFCNLLIFNNYLLIFLLAVLLILGSIKHVAEDVSQVKDIIQTRKADVKEGFKEIQGKHIWLTIWFEEIHWENVNHVEDVIWLNISKVFDNLMLQRKRFQSDAYRIMLNMK